MLNGTQTIHSWNTIERGERWVRNNNSSLSVVSKNSKLAAEQRRIPLAEVFTIMHQTLRTCFKDQQNISRPCKREVEELKTRVHESYENYLYHRGLLRRIRDAITRVFFNRISIDHSYKELIKLLCTIGDIELERQQPPAPPVASNAPIAAPPIQSAQIASPRRYIDLTKGYSREDYIRDLIMEGRDPSTVAFLNPDLNQSPLVQTVARAPQPRLDENLTPTSENIIIIPQHSNDSGRERRFQLLSENRQRLEPNQAQKPRTYNPLILNRNNKGVNQELPPSLDWESFLTQQETPKNTKVVLFVTNDADRHSMKAWTDEVLEDIVHQKDMSYHILIKENSKTGSQLLNNNTLKNDLLSYQTYCLDKKTGSSLVSFEDFAPMLTQHPSPAQNRQKTSVEIQEKFNENLQAFVKRCLNEGKEVRLILDQPTLTKNCFDYLQNLSANSNNMFRINAHRSAY